MLYNKILIKHELDAGTLSNFLADPVNSSLFEGGANEFLAIKLKIDEYIPTLEGEEIRIIEGMTIPVVDLPHKRYKFEINSKDGRIAAYLTLFQMWTYRNSHTGPYELIDIFDYVNPEANNLGFIKRTCVMTNLQLTGGFASSEYKRYGGTIENGISRRIGNGFTATFIQIKPDETLS